MSLEEKSIQVENFYTQLDNDLLTYQTKSGLACIAGCSNCCRSPEVETTILELLPLAFDLYKRNKAEIFYDDLLKQNSPICALYSPIKALGSKGGCNNYPKRALICRLFGFSYTRDKLGNPKLLACKEIKEVHETAYKKSIKDIHEGSEVPMAANYQSQLSAIDPNLSQRFYPINKAMMLAIEMVMTHFYYTDVESNDVKNAS